jgi:hypothetical protein
MLAQGLNKRHWMIDIQSDRYHNHVIIPHHLLHMAQTSSTESSDQRNILDREIQPTNNSKN